MSDIEIYSLKKAVSSRTFLTESFLSPDIIYRKNIVCINMVPYMELNTTMNRASGYWNNEIISGIILEN